MVTPVTNDPCRPASISSSTATAVPLRIENTSATLLAPRTDLGFFVKSVELYEIVYRTVKRLYSATRPSDPRSPSMRGGSLPSPEEEAASADLCTVLQLDTALTNWEKWLPEKLRYISSHPRDQVNVRQAIILRLRLLHAQVLLLRPVMGRFCLAHSNDVSALSNSLESRVHEQCATLCVNTAQDIVATLLEHQLPEDNISLLPAWWYRVYYVYTAATVLIAAKLRPKVFATHELNRSWGQAVSVLKALEAFGPSAKRCAAALHFLSSKILDVVPETANEPARDTDIDPLHQGSDLEVGDFSMDMGDFSHFEMQDDDFDINNLAWLNDMHATWDLLNHG